MAYASNFCDDDLGVHNVDPCLTDREFGRTRSGGFIKKSYLATLLLAPLLQATWDAGLASGDIIIMPETAGSFDPGDPKVLKGYGDILEGYGPRSMTLNLFDPDYKKNYGFYNGIKNQKNLVPFYRTSSLVHIFDTAAAIDAKDPVEDDIETEVVWNVICKVISENLPAKYPIATISQTFDRLYVATEDVPTTFDTELVFDTDVSDSAEGVTGTAGATDAQQKFEFNAITPQIGTPQSMTIEVSAVEELVVDFTDDYIGEAFRYTDIAGVVHTGTFINGTVNF